MLEFYRRLRSAIAARATVADGMAGLVIEVSGLFTTLVSFTLLGRRLGPTDYGALVAMYSLIGIGSCLAYIGPGLALLQLAMQRTLGAVAGHFFGEQMLFTGIAFVGVVVLAPVFVSSVPITTVLMFLIAELVGLALITLAANLRIAASGYKAALRLQLIPLVLRMLIIGGLAFLGDLTLATYGLVLMVTSTVVGVAAFVVVTRSLGLSRRPRGIEAKHVRATLSMSSTIWAWGLHDNGDKLVMSAYNLGPAVGLYAAAYRLVQLGLVPVNALATSTFRSFLDPEVGRQTKRAVKLSVVVTGYTTVAALAIIVLAPIVIRILAGPGFDGSVTMARWLAPVLILRGILTFPGNALVGLDRAHSRLVAYMGSAAVGMAIYIWLIPSLSWKGAVIGSYVTDIVLVVTLWTMLIVRTRSLAQAEQALELQNAHA